MAEEQVSLRCQSVKDRGVPMPNGWQLAIQALKLPEIARRSAAKAIAEFGYDGLECKVLGIARSLPELSGALHDQIGSLRVLSSPDIGRRPAVLCAHVRGTEWLCHYFCDGDDGHVFDIDRVALADVESTTVVDAVEEEVDPLMRAIYQNKFGFSNLLAEAAWRAEEHRASSCCAKLDAGIAAEGYESNPFLWQHGSRVRVCVVWSFLGYADSGAPGAKEVVPSKFGWHSLHNALSEGWSFPLPRLSAVRPTQGDELRARLEDKAKWEEKRTMCPCGYLGYLVRGRGDAWTDQFEPDPAKWPEAALQAAGRRDKIIVWYEWKYVTKGPDKKPVRVSQRVEHAIGRQQEQWMTPCLDTTEPIFGFSDEHGEYAFTAQEVLKLLLDMKLHGTPKFEAAQGVSKFFALATEDLQWGNEAGMQEVGEAYTKELIIQLEAVAAMPKVDALLLFPEGFVDIIRRAPLGHDVVSEVDVLREPLRTFLHASARLSQESKLRDCYVAVDAALASFQQTWANHPADAMDELVRVMNELNKGLSTGGPSRQDLQQIFERRLPQQSGVQGSFVHFKPGTRVVLRGLRSRPEQAAHVISVPTSSQPRYGVELLSTKERILVKVENVHAPMAAGDLEAPL